MSARDEPLLHKDFLMKEVYRDLINLQKHIEELGVRAKRYSYSAMRTNEEDPACTDIFLPIVGCTLGEFSLTQLVKL